MPSLLLEAYLNKRNETLSDITSGCLAFLANLDTVAQVSPVIARAIVQELEDQRSNIKLIASENYSSLATQCAMANLLTDKYAEGIPFKRFYAGCDNVDVIEEYACEKARELFGAEHAYVQPHSGADANLVAFWAILGTNIEIPKLGQRDSLSLSDDEWEALRQELGNQRLLAMDLRSGGHLTHGFRKNVSARMFNVHTYSVDRTSGVLNYDELKDVALRVKPLILLAGYSAYPRRINFQRMREIADEANAVLMVDMAHFAGLVAGKVFQGEHDPIPYADVVTTTTHKTLRGPRGGLVLCKKRFAEQVDKGCPIVLGGPLAHVMAAKAVCFTEALRPEFKSYAQRVVDNARVLGDALLERGLHLVTGGTDNHLILVDVTPFGLTGRQAEAAVRECGITLNRNTIPFDPNGAWYTSGLRLGTPAITTLGMGASEMAEIASILALSLSNTSPQRIETGISKAKYNIADDVKQSAKRRVERLLSEFRVYPEIDSEFLGEFFADL